MYRHLRLDVDEICTMYCLIANVDKYVHQQLSKLSYITRNSDNRSVAIIIRFTVRYLLFDVHLAQFQIFIECCFHGNVRQGQF